MTPPRPTSPRKPLPLAPPPGPAPDPAPTGPPVPLGPLRHPAEAYRRLEAVYEDLERELGPIRPRCDARGLCCDFDAVDHVLYASKLEVDYVKDHVARERYAAPTGNVCPLLDGALCGARAVRMLGCRIYYCDPAWQAPSADLYEKHYARIKAIAVDLGLEWRYAPALVQLREPE